MGCTYNEKLNLVYYRYVNVFFRLNVVSSYNTLFETFLQMFVGVNT